MLTQTLRFLEKEKIINKKVYPVVPSKVEYTLTDKGKSLLPILKSLQEWGKEQLKNRNYLKFINCIYKVNFKP